jgi:hypothetical protein
MYRIHTCGELKLGDLRCPCGGLGENVGDSVLSAGVERHAQIGHGRMPIPMHPRVTEVSAKRCSRERICRECRQNHRCLCPDNLLRSFGYVGPRGRGFQPRIAGHTNPIERPVPINVCESSVHCNGVGERGSARASSAAEEERGPLVRHPYTGRLVRPCRHRIAHFPEEKGRRQVSPHPPFK